MMNDSFQNAMTQLRREKGLSQKAAAAQLNTSQALLSHYENGVRECGLDFVVRAARFYGVTCDYLLGNSSGRDGLPAYENEDLVPNEQLEQISSGVILNAVHELLLQTEGNEAWRKNVKRLIVLEIYRTLLAFMPEDGCAQQGLLCDAEIKLTEAKITGSRQREKSTLAEESPLAALAASAKKLIDADRD